MGTHRFVVLHDLLPHTSRPSPFIEHHRQSDFEQATVKTLQMCRAALTYAREMVLWRERRLNREGKLRAPMYVPPHHDIRGLKPRLRQRQRVITVEVSMGMPVKLSDELVESAREEAANTDRSITGQIEHWAKIGRSVETVLRHQEVQTLKRSPQDVRLTGAARRAIEAALERVVTETDRRSLARRLKAGRTVYQSDPAGSGLTERIEPDGRRTLGRFMNRRFVPERATRSGHR